MNEKKNEKKSDNPKKKKKHQSLEAIGIKFQFNSERVFRIFLRLFVIMKEYPLTLTKI